MPGFRPAGCSSPRPTPALPTELQTLTPDEVQLLDSVIQRSTPAATTFLTVFKAYNDVLLERGLDPNEVRYYNKLLKLGTMRGETWGEKWQTVKRGLQLPKPAASMTMHDSDFDDALTEAPQRQRTSLLTARRTDRTPARTPRQQDWRTRMAHPSSSDAVSDHSVLTPASSASHRVAIRDRHQSAQKPLQQPLHTAAEVARQRLAQAREKRGSDNHDLDSVWAKLAHEKQLEEADAHYRATLLTRCFTLWHLNLEWLRTTQAQIDDARKLLDLRVFFERWKQKMTERKAFEIKVMSTINGWVLKRALEKWKVVYTKRSQEKWRNEMRHRLKVFRRDSAHRLMRTFYLKWSWALRERLATHQYEQKLLRNFTTVWIRKLDGIAIMERRADEARSRMEITLAGELWERWKRMTQLVALERVMNIRVGVRVQETAWLTWRKKTRDFQLADVFHNNYLVAKSLKRWREKRVHVEALEQRADKHFSRSNDLLLRAVTRVWRARERGKLVERSLDSRLLTRTWDGWKSKVRRLAEMEDTAVQFYQRPTNNLLRSSLQKWFTSTSNRMAAVSYADQQYNTSLLRRSLVAWREHLKATKRSMRLADKAEQRFICRRILRLWKDQTDERVRERKVLFVETRWKAKLFHVWLERAQNSKRMRKTEVVVRSMVDQRVLKECLTRWTNRVIDIKLRELEVIQVGEARILRNAFLQWKTVYHRHEENTNLMESFLLVKREETLRRVFDHWSNRMHNVRVLRDKENEFKRELLVKAWERWRDRFADERLRSIEDTVMVMVQHGAMKRALAKWRGNTKTLPAIRFHASHLKARSWKRWRSVMPMAAKLKQAKDMDRTNVLAWALDKWVSAHRTKLTLKAVARARNLRLPTATPRHVARPPITALPPTPLSNKPTFIGRHAPAESLAPDTSIEENDLEDEEASEEEVRPSSRWPVSRSKPILSWPNRPKAALSKPASRSGVTPALSVRSDISPPRNRFPVTNHSSPTRSTAFPVGSASRLFIRKPDTSPIRPPPLGIATPSPSESVANTGEVGRSRLWRELQGIRGRSRARTEGSRTHSP